jgi:hypothetical protein
MQSQARTAKSIHHDFEETGRLKSGGRRGKIGFAGRSYLAAEEKKTFCPNSLDRDHYKI